MSGELREVDMTGHLSSIQDIEESIQVVGEVLAKEWLGLPPYLGVQMATIHRCLKEYLRMRKKLQVIVGREDA